jgi:hypothetical protein
MEKWTSQGFLLASPASPRTKQWKDSTDISLVEVHWLVVNIWLMMMVIIWLMMVNINIYIYIWLVVKQGNRLTRRPCKGDEFEILIFDGKRLNAGICRSRQKKFATWTFISIGRRVTQE